MENEGIIEKVNMDPLIVPENEFENESKDILKSEELEDKPITRKGQIIYDNEGNEKYQCLICKAEFIQKQRLDNPISAIHEGNKEFLCYDRDGKQKFQCLICKSEFNEKGSVTSHISAVHEGKKPHKCTQCDFAASKKTTLKLHITTVHEGIRPFKCDICHNTFKAKQNLRNHMASIHDDSKPFQCTICFRTFSVERNLKRHNCKDMPEISESPIKRPQRIKKKLESEDIISDFFSEDIGHEMENQTPSSVDLQLNLVLQHVQLLVENQNLDELQTFLNELNSFLLNLKIILDTGFTPSNLEENVNFVQFVKPLAALYGIKNKVILALTHPLEVDNLPDLKENIVKVEANDLDYSLDDFKDNTGQVKSEVIETEYNDTGNDPDYNVNDDIGDDNVETIEENNTQGVQFITEHF